MRRSRDYDAVVTVTAHNEGNQEDILESKFNEHACFFTFRAVITGGSCYLSRPEEIGAIQWVELEQADDLLPYYQNSLQDIVRNTERTMYVNQGVVT